MAARWCQYIMSIAETEFRVTYFNWNLPGKWFNFSRFQEQTHLQWYGMKKKGGSGREMTACIYLYITCSSIMGSLARNAPWGVEIVHCKCSLEIMSNSWGNNLPPTPQPQLVRLRGHIRHTCSHFLGKWAFFLGGGAFVSERFFVKANHYQ